MSSLSSTISKYIPLAGRKPKIDKKQALAIVPVRHPLVTWECRDNSEIVLAIPARDDKIARLVKRFVKNLPSIRQIGLDDVGSSVWELCDGERTIDAIVGCTCRTHKLTRREAEVSVTMFLQTLAKKNLIGLMSAGGNKSVKRKR